MMLYSYIYRVHGQRRRFTAKSKDIYMFGLCAYVTVCVCVCVLVWW